MGIAAEKIRYLGASSSLTSFIAPTKTYMYQSQSRLPLQQSQLNLVEGQYEVPPLYTIFRQH